MVLFDEILLYVRDFIASIGVLVIVIGAVNSLYQLFMLVAYQTFTVNYIRLQFAKSITLSLEFMVAADIVGSLVKPDYYSLGLLGILVVIRIVLSYFLNLELEGLTPQQQEHLKSV